MKLVYTSDDYMQAGQIQSLLESNDIPCFMKNETLTGAIGELPLNECWPEIWIRNDNDENKTLKLIDLFINESKLDISWICRCGEKIEGQFTECWKCGYAIK